jgi:hypothetical protein
LCASIHLSAFSAQSCKTQHNTFWPDVGQLLILCNQ